MSVSSLKVAIAPGELVDKITILEIKSERIGDPEKRANVRHELDVLTTTRAEALPASPELDGLTADLKAINEKLWQIEDDIRDCEAAKNFDGAFVELARSVYICNDERARIKREINLLLGSDIIEEKSYKPY